MVISIRKCADEYPFDVVGTSSLTPWIFPRIFAKIVPTSTVPSVIPKSSSTDVLNVITDSSRLSMPSGLLMMFVFSVDTWSPGKPTLTPTSLSKTGSINSARGLPSLMSKFTWI